MIAAHLVDLGSCFDLAAAREEAARLAVEELWTAVPDGADHFTTEAFLGMRERVATELGARVGASGVTLAAVTRLLEQAGTADEALALSVDAIYRDARDRAAAPIPGVAAVLAEWAARTRLGFVAIGSIDWRVLGVEPDTVIVPRALGLHRADTALIERAAERLGVVPVDLVVVAPEGSPLLAAAAIAGAQQQATGNRGIGNDR